MSDEPTYSLRRDGEVAPDVTRAGQARRRLVWAGAFFALAALGVSSGSPLAVISIAAGAWSVFLSTRARRLAVRLIPEGLEVDDGLRRRRWAWTAVRGVEVRSHLSGSTTWLLVRRGRPVRMDALAGGRWGLPVAEADALAEELVTLWTEGAPPQEDERLDGVADTGSDGDPAADAADAG